MLFAGQSMATVFAKWGSPQFYSARAKGRFVDGEANQLTVEFTACPSRVKKVF